MTPLTILAAVVKWHFKWKYFSMIIGIETRHTNLNIFQTPLTVSPRVYRLHGFRHKTFVVWKGNFSFSTFQCFSCLMRQRFQIVLRGTIMSFDDIANLIRLQIVPFFLNIHSRNIKELFKDALLTSFTFYREIHYTNVEIQSEILDKSKKAVTNYTWKHMITRSNAGLAWGEGARVKK